jgi:hypothetical protein
MKLALPFYGVPAPLRQRLVKLAVATHPLADNDALCTTAMRLWRDATHREQPCAALDLLRRHPAHMKPLLWHRTQSPNLWFRRAAMLGQRSLKGPDFAAALLFDCILLSLPPSPLAGEFFNRKGMGWALGERSYSAPKEVQAFCAECRGGLSPLTLREALKRPS